MFGITADLPASLIMREQIVLYCAPYDPVDGERTKAIIEPAATLDMARARRDIAQQREGRASLFARRLCPTAWRSS
jgi:hypothetical protein